MVAHYSHDAPDHYLYRISNCVAYLDQASFASHFLVQACFLTPWIPCQTSTAQKEKAPYEWFVNLMHNLHSRVRTCRCVCLMVSGINVFLFQ